MTCMNRRGGEDGTARRLGGGDMCGMRNAEDAEDASRLRPTSGSCLSLSHTHTVFARNETAPPRCQHPKRTPPTPKNTRQLGTAPGSKQNTEARKNQLCGSGEGAAQLKPRRTNRLLGGALSADGRDCEPAGQSNALRSVVITFSKASYSRWTITPAAIRH